MVDLLPRRIFLSSEASEEDVMRVVLVVVLSTTLAIAGAAAFATATQQ
jgi:hypothetical protein